MALAAQGATHSAPAPAQSTPTSGRPIPMHEMSDDEADNIVVAMAGPHGPLANAFEVEAAARAPHNPTPASPTAAAAAEAASAPATPDAADAAADAVPPANNTRLVRVKSQLCSLWRVDPATLDAAFDSRSRDFFAKLYRLAQIPSVDFRMARRELNRARHARINGKAMDFSLRGVPRDCHWAPGDVDRAIDTIEDAASSARKRTAASTPAETPPKRQRSSASVSSTAHAESSRGMPNDLSLEDEADYESNRASVPHAASVERELESQQKPRPQHRPIDDQTIHVQTPAQQAPSRLQSAGPLPAQATAGIEPSSNDVPPPTPRETPVGRFHGVDLLDGRPVRASVDDSPHDRSEALRRLESPETLPPHIFNQVLQDFCCASASHVVHAPITVASPCPQPDSPFFWNNFDSIMLPFHLGGRWTLATIDPKHEEAKLYGPSSALNTTQTATERFLAASINIKDTQSWRMTRVPIASPPDPQDEPITCLVTAIHIIAGSVTRPSDAETDPIFWRRALAAFVRGISAVLVRGTSAAPQPPATTTTTTTTAAAAAASATLIPPTTAPLSIADFFTHLETHLVATCTSSNDDLHRLRTRARSYKGTYALLNALAGKPRVSAELSAYASRNGQLPEAIANVESTVASLTRLGIDGTVRELEACARGLREVRRQDGGRVVRLKALVECRESIKNGLAAVEEEESAEIKRLEGALKEVRGELDAARQGLKEKFDT